MAAARGDEARAEALAGRFEEMRRAPGLDYLRTACLDAGLRSDRTEARRAPARSPARRDGREPGRAARLRRAGHIL